MQPKLQKMRILVGHPLRQPPNYTSEDLGDGEELEMIFGNSAIWWQHQTGIGIVTQFRQKCHITKEALQIRDHALLSSAPHHAKDMLTPV